MKKKKVNLKQLALKKSRVASLESNSVTGGFQSWTGTAEPCFPSEFNCGGTNGCPQPTDGCPPQTNGCYTNGCPPQTQNCPPQTLLCNSHSVCPPGVYCY
ncbi:hypothetical protein U8527_07810 [Kordia algicida OT-1]|uniref:Uncharacterized protein n=1 Tax=Kordia algicida OT-1 TaxID=391587 RepID=A9E8T5_9FLAO|nr:hypothetical protein [Kordia algicida]EDP94809.1 hypothetical protein KAOT1_01245 [Kordia algicida OT-1]